MPGSADDVLDLQQAADALGVHYQTAYRWVRSGRLAARVVGGRYEIAPAAIEAVLAARSAPAPPAAPGRRRIERQAEPMYEALMSGDESGARRIARRLVDEGTSVVALIETVISPSLARIGQAWHDGQISIWVEHRASAVVERILGELAPNPRGRRRGTAMVAAVSGDRHSLPTAMAAVALREANWHVHHLGADMPPEEFLPFCEAHGVDVAVVSLTNPDVASLAEHAADLLRAGGVPALVGGPGTSLRTLLDEAREALAR